MTKAEATSPITLIHVAPVGGAAAAGLATSVPGLHAAQSLLPGVKSLLVDSSRSSAARSSDNLDYLVPLGRHRTLEFLPAPFRAPDLVVFHSTYIPQHVWLGRHLKRLGIPYVLVPRGGLTLQAQSIKRPKKWISNLLAFRRFVEAAEAIHFLSEGERTNSAGWHPHSFIAGNGVHLPNTEDCAKPGADIMSKLAYVGRLNIYIKGLDLLLDAVEMVKGRLELGQATMVLYGPGDEKDLEYLRRRIKDGRIEHLVSLGGALDAIGRNNVLKGADGFVLTSRTEGLPMAVLEALGHGVPCLLTRSTNLAEEVVEHDAGWLAESNAASIATMLESFVESRKRLEVIGYNARQLALRRYGWQGVAVETTARYRELVHSRVATASPPSVRSDNFTSKG